MQYQDQNYKDASNDVHFLSAQDQATASASGLPFPDPSWSPITQAQAQVLLNPAPTAAQVQAALQATAQTALDTSDITMLRCMEASVSVPAAWNTYRKALRAIATGKDTSSTSLPTKPAYPAGT